MDTRKRTTGWAGLLMALGLLVVIPGLSLAQDRLGAEEGILIRVNGDVTLGADEHEGVVVVVQGNATIHGTAEVVVVVGGTATLSGAHITELVVVQGRALLHEGTVITGDVQLVNSEVDRSAGVVVEGRFRYGSSDRIGGGLLVFGMVFGLGAGIAVLLSGLIAAAIAPHSVRAAGAALTDNFGKTLLAMLIVWAGFPVVAGICMATFIGAPFGLGILLFLLPGLGFLGYLVAGIRLGDSIMGAVRGRDEAWHPYLAAVLGVGVLVVVGWIPVLGAVISVVAAFLGGGALALRAWDMIWQPSKPSVVNSPA